MRIQLVRKLSPLLNGIDLTRQRVGDVLDVTAREAQLLIAEGWATPVPDDHAGEPAFLRRKARRLRRSAESE